MTNKMTNKEAIKWIKEVQSHIDLEAGGYTQEMYDAIELAIKTLKRRTMRLGDLDALKREIDTIKQTAYDGNEEPVYFVELPDLIKVIDNAPTVVLPNEFIINHGDSHAEYWDNIGRAGKETEERGQEGE